MPLAGRLYPTLYDWSNGPLEAKLAPYRRQTAGQASGRVLEIGAGTGANLPFYPPGARVTVADANLHMMRRLRQKARRQGRSIAACQAVGEDLAFADASFDTVTTALVLCSVADLPRVLAEIRWVLRPGGTFYFLEHVAAAEPGLLRWQKRINPLWRRVTGGCHLDRDIGAAIQAAGFAQTEITRFDAPVPQPLIRPQILGQARR